MILYALTSAMEDIDVHRVNYFQRALIHVAKRTDPQLSLDIRHSDRLTEELSERNDRMIQEEKVKYFSETAVEASEERPHA